jgi:hypothetical protein
MKEHIKHIKEKIDKFGILKILIVLIVASIIFQAGIFVGYHKAGFYRSMGENYRPFEDKGRGANKFGNKGGMMDGIRDGGRFMMQGENIPGGHGAVGKIVSINLPTIVVASPDNVEKTVNISDDTLVRQFRETVSATDLKVGEYVVVIGDNSNTDNTDNGGINSGVVKAKLIRLLPPPPDEQSVQNKPESSTQLTPSATSTRSSLK